MEEVSPREKIRVSNFEDLLKAKGMKLERGRRVIDRLINNNKARIIKNNPEKKYRRQQPKIDSLEHYSQSQYSAESEDERIQVPSRALPRIDTNHSIRHEQIQGSQLFDQNTILAQKAKLFVNRLRKQKQYEQGKAVVRRKKEEQMRQKRQRQMQRKKEREQSFFKVDRYNKMMESILYHEERINHRLKNSIFYRKHRGSGSRMRTEGNEDFQKRQGSRSVMFVDEGVGNSTSARGQLPMIASLKKKVALLSSMIDSLQH